MDLHSGESIWQIGKQQHADYPRLAGEIRCQVAIVGAGITGTLISYLLNAAGQAVVLLDRGTPGEGSTAASTGLLQHAIDTPLSELISLVGRDRAVHAYQRGLKAIDEIEAIVERVAGKCGFSRRSSMYFASHWCDLAGLKKEIECRRAHGLPAEFLDRRQLAAKTSIRAAGALWSEGDAQIDPYAFTNALLKYSAAEGLRVFQTSEVLSVEEGAGEVRLSLANGVVIADAVVMASGYEAHQQLPGWPGKLHSTYALASTPLDEYGGWPDGCLIWETARPYFYARQTEDGRAIIGGGDTAFANDHQRDGLVERKTAALMKRFQGLFPGIKFELAAAWAGTFAETKDGLAYIGRVPGKSRTLAALGYGGNGITFSMIAARLITDLCLGNANADEKVFCFER